MSIAVTSTFVEEGVMAFEWAGILNAENGNPIQAAKWPTKAVHVSGTLGAGGSMSIQGSNDLANWVILRDSLGVALTFTALPGLRDVLENPQFIRAVVTAGDGTTNFKVRIIAS
jgi:hypothetical protein